MVTYNSTKKGEPAIEGDGIDVGIVGKAQDGWAISGESKKQVGVRGYCDDGWGVAGESKNQVGVRGNCDPGWGVAGSSKTGVGVRGECDSFIGVAGESNVSTGVFGHSKTATGVHGKSDSTTGGAGVLGESAGSGVIGISQTWMGVYGETQSTTGGAGVWGEHKADGIGTVGKSNTGVGVMGISETGEAIHAETKSGDAAAVIGINESTGPGVRGVSHGFDGVTGESLGDGKAGVAGVNTKGIGVYGRGRLAGFFDGDVEVTGDIRLTNADCAEDFTIGTDVSVEPGTVMVLGDEGALFPSHKAYDRCVAGVVSGAGEYKPGIVLDKQESKRNRQPIALLGKVYCKVDAQYSAIEIGDLLTTSPTPGHAMKAEDPHKAFGAIIGKALRSLGSGRGLIPILIALQ